MGRRQGHLTGCAGWLRLLTRATNGYGTSDKQRGENAHADVISPHDRARGFCDLRYCVETVHGDHLLLLGSAQEECTERAMSEAIDSAVVSERVRFAARGGGDTLLAGRHAQPATAMEAGHSL